MTRTSMRRTFAWSDRRKWTLRVFSLVVVIAVWEAAARALHSLLFPSPLDTLTAFTQLVVQPSFWQSLWISNQAMIVGYAFAVVTGISLGLWMGRSRLVEQIVNPYLSILLATPMSALIPILILAAGFGLTSRALVVFFFSFVVIVVNTRAGMRTLDSSLIEMARTLGAGEWQLWRAVLIPGALPAIVTGLRLGLGRALTGMVAVELTLVAVGIGRLILDFQGMFEAGAVYATILVVILEAVFLLGALRWLERRIAPWYSLARPS